MKSKNTVILKEIITTVLKLKGDVDFLNLEQSNLSKWDSIAIINLVVAVESEFGVKISNNELENFTSFKKIVSILDGKGL
tara:strand:- start:10184 stop:10423 length:240 start_codon:yes stop_codon:yes gene_type:complete